MNEKYIRVTIDAIAKDDFINNRPLCVSIVNCLNLPKKVHTDVISALKFLIYAEKLLLYAPQLFECSIDAEAARQSMKSPHLQSQNLIIFENIHNNWMNVIKGKINTIDTNII